MTGTRRRSSNGSPLMFRKLLLLEEGNAHLRYVAAEALQGFLGLSNLPPDERVLVEDALLIAANVRCEPSRDVRDRAMQSLEVSMNPAVARCLMTLARRTTEETPDLCDLARRTALSVHRRARVVQAGMDVRVLQ